MTPNVLVAPSYGKPSAKRHFHDTIEGWVPFADAERGPLLTDEQRERLLALHPSGAAHFWGAEEKHTKMMSELKRGDIVIFIGGGKVKAYGEVGHLFVNEKFADKLWREPDESESFLHVYSVVNVRMVDRPKSDLTTLCGYKANYEIPGQRLLRERDVPKVLREFGITTSVLETQLEELIERNLDEVRRSWVTPVERVHKKKVKRTTTASTTVTDRVEAGLVEIYQRFCEPEKLVAFRTDSDLRADLYRENGDEVEIIEAKSLATHGKVREAVAQLLDYAVHSVRPVTRLSALFPSKPDRDGLAYLHRLGIDCVYLVDGGSFKREEASDSRREHMIPVWRGL